jgi:hypothetical protein
MRVINPLMIVDQNFDWNSDTDQDIDTSPAIDARARAANDAYPPPTKILRHYEISDLLPPWNKLYFRLQKIVARKDQASKDGRDDFLQPKFIKRTDWLDDLPGKVIDAVRKIRFFPNIPIPINAISIDAYSSQFQWVDWSQRVVNGPPRQFYREVKV